MAKKTGLDMKAYLSSTALDGSSNTPGTVTWTEVPEIRDATPSIEVGEADVSSRASVFRERLTTLLDLGVDFSIVWDSGNANMQALRDACLNRTTLAMAFMDGPIATEGSEGPVANMHVFGFSRAEQLEDGVTVDLSVKPASHTEWYEVPAA